MSENMPDVIYAWYPVHRDCEIFASKYHHQTPAVEYIRKSIADDLAEALRDIIAWKMPPSGLKHTDGTPMSYGVAFGSNGEREYIKEIAKQILSRYEQLLEGKQSP